MAQCQNYSLRMNAGLILTESGGEFGKGDMCEREATHMLDGHHLCKHCYDYYVNGTGKSVGGWLSVREIEAIIALEKTHKEKKNV